MKKTMFITLSGIVLLLLACIYNNVALPVTLNSEKTIIIDAGHGYPDGGAVAPDGTAESDLNLALSLLIRDKLEKAGVNCILIRSDENGIYTDGNTIHAKKVSDIRNRVKIASESEDALVLSIHMNTFPDPNIRGAQFFYKSNSEMSKQIAKELQNAINIKFQSDNIKTVKSISKNIYFLNNIKNDCILAECGFLTNSDDLSKLKSVEFRDELATAIAEVIIYKFGGSD